MGQQIWKIFSLVNLVSSASGESASRKPDTTILNIHKYSFELQTVYKKPVHLVESFSVLAAPRAWQRETTRRAEGERAASSASFRLRLSEPARKHLRDRRDPFRRDELSDDLHRCLVP